MKIQLLILFLLSSISFSSFSQSRANPYVESVDDVLCYISKVEITSKYTIVSFEHKNNKSWIQLNKKIFIETPDKGRFNYIKSEGISIAPEEYYFKEGEDKHAFKVYFEALPKNVKSFNIIENEGDRYAFNFYGVSLEKSRTSDIQTPHTAIISSEATVDSVEASSAPNFSSMFDNIGSVVSNMFKSMVDASIEYYKQPGKLTDLAKLNKSYYDALIKEGFSKEQALQILISDPLIFKGGSGNK